MYKFSIIIPIFNESENIYSLVDEIFSLIENKFSFEIILVDDGSQDNTNQVLNIIKKKYSNVIIVTHQKNMGQSRALLTGIIKSKYNNILTLDGDGQNNPNDITKLLKIYFNSNYFLIGGIRLNRKDNLVKKISSKLANFIRQSLLKDECMDTGCSLKIFDKKIFLNFPFFNGIHRFLPALFKGYNKETYFIEVDHRPRVAGVSKYGTFDRLFIGIRDIIKVRKIIINNKKSNV